MRRRIFGHLGLKVLSIALATLVWWMVAGQREAERSLRAPLEFRSIPDQLELVGEPPGLVDVRLRGHDRRLGAAADERGGRGARSEGRTSRARACFTSCPATSRSRPVSRCSR